MKKILIYIFLIIFIISAFSFWSIVSKGYDRQNKVILILKKTKTLVFINCEVSNDKGLVISASGTWKIL